MIGLDVPLRGSWETLPSGVLSAEWQSRTGEPQTPCVPSLVGAGGANRRLPERYGQVPVVSSQVGSARTGPGEQWASCTKTRPSMTMM